MVCTAYYTQLILQICNFTQKWRICHEKETSAWHKFLWLFLPLPKGCQLLPPCSKMQNLIDWSTAPMHMHLPCRAGVCPLLGDAAMRRHIRLFGKDGSLTHQVMHNGNFDTKSLQLICWCLVLPNFFSLLLPTFCDKGFSEIWRERSRLPGRWKGSVLWKRKGKKHGQTTLSLRSTENCRLWRYPGRIGVPS